MPTVLLSLILACATNPPPAPSPGVEPTATAATRTPADAVPAPEPSEEAQPTDEAQPTEETEPTDGAEPAEEADPAEPPPAEPAPGDTTTTAEPKAGGEACLTADECASGVCEGEGCGDDAPGTCAPERRACTRDLRQYCGCDGDTFGASGTCPMHRYAHKGPCEANE